MTVHVDEIHTQVHPGGSGPAAAAAAGAGAGQQGAVRPGAREDDWCSAEARVRQLRCRVAAEGFDD